MRLAKLSVKNPVFVNLMMVTIIVMGLVALLDLPRELMPEVAFHWAFVAVSYDGVSPEEIEKLITIPIEDELTDIEHINMVTSTSSEGLSQIMIQFDNISDNEFDKQYQDFKSKITGLRNLPEDAEDPYFMDFGSDDFMPMVNVVLSGDLPEIEMKNIADDLKREIENIKNIAKIEFSGVREREIWVEVDPERLYSYNLAMNHVVNAIAMKNLNLPGGTFKMGRAEYMLRTIGEVNNASELEKVIIRKSINDGGVLLSNVAVVRDTLEKPESYSRLNGNTSITLSISKKPEGNVINLVEEIGKIVETKNRILPEGVKLEMVNDVSKSVNQILSVLESNALMGLIMVLLVLWVFLGWRNALMAALGIPVTFMATFIFLRATGNSLNGTSLFGLVLVLGIIVDDAIIVIENCYRYIQKGIKPHIAAVIGTSEVITPVFAATATTVAAFLPLMLVPGIMGEFFKVMPIVVSLALVASLVEAFGILPSHVAEWSVKKYNKATRAHKFLTSIRLKYLRLLKRLLRKRHLAIIGVFILFLVSVSLVFLYLGVEMFSGDEIPQFFVWVTMPEGTSLDETDRIIRELEVQALQLPQDDIIGIVANSGILQSETEWLFKPNVGQLVLELTPAKERDRDLDSYINELRRRTSDVTGMKSIEFSKVNTGPPAGAPVEVNIRGKDFDILRNISSEIQTYLRDIQGVYDVKDNFNFGKKEVKIKIDEDRAAFYGLNIFQVATSIRTAFDGARASKFRDEDEEIDVLVKFREDSRNSIQDLEKIKIATPSNQLINLKDIAEFSVEQSYSAIYRIDRERAITVTADVDQAQANANALNSQLLRDFEDLGARYPGYAISLGGEFAEFEESMQGLWKLFLVGLFLIYIILGGQFRSFLQPLIILYTIPFAFIGAIFGLMIIKAPFSLSTMYGVVALAGIVVNDSLVLISFINNARQAGVSRWKSIMQAGVVRLRPIILTSVTTIFGLLPMAIGLGGKSATWGPLATTIVGGLCCSTIFTLFIIPCLFAGVDDVKLFFGAKSLKPTPHLEEIDALTDKYREAYKRA
ncbi:efflux RND transporter permease subunit [candidate division KSB1 bacterium]